MSRCPPKLVVACLVTRSMQMAFVVTMQVERLTQRYKNLFLTQERVRTALEKPLSKSYAMQVCRKK